MPKKIKSFQELFAEILETIQSLIKKAFEKINESNDPTPSFSKTPQARDDDHVLNEDDLSPDFDGSMFASLDVMNNDRGGRSKSLYSIDDGQGDEARVESDLLNKDVEGEWEATAAGNWIRIQDGKIDFRPDQGLADLGITHINALKTGDVITDQFVYAIQLGKGTLSHANVEVTLEGQNDAPIVTGDITATVSADEAVEVEGALQASDVDRNSSLTWKLPNGEGEYGTLTLDDEGHWVYELDIESEALRALGEGESADDVLTVEAIDDQGAITEQTITVTVNGSNDAPSAETDRYRVTRNTEMALDVLANDSDVDGDTIQITEVGASDLGTIAISPDGQSLNFTAGAETGIELIDYSITDSFGRVSTGQLSVIVQSDIVKTGTSGDDSLDFSSLTDDITIESDPGNDTIVSGSGDDLIVWQYGHGNDVIDGGAGFDHVLLELSKDQAQSLTISPDNGLVIVSGIGFNLTLDGVEDLSIKGGDAGLEVDLQDLVDTDIAQDTVRIEGGAGNDRLNANNYYWGGVELFGKGGNDILEGSYGGNHLYGGDGNDRLYSVGGILTIGNLLDGGAGFDRAYLKHPTIFGVVPIVVDLASGTSNNGDTLRNIEDVFTAEADDILKGDENNNLLVSAGGNDVLEGRGGNDRLYGEEGRDTASYESAPTGVTVRLDQQNRYQDTVGAGRDKLVSIENLTGSQFDDNLRGGEDSNVIYGLGGDDFINARGGNDTVDGGAGDDRLHGSFGRDTVSFLSATSSVTVKLSIIDAQDTGGAGTDTITAFENLQGSNYDDELWGDSISNVISGASGNDLMYGIAGDDELRGDAGDDVLDGGLGDDRLKGGEGSDTASYLTSDVGIWANLNVNGQFDTHGAGMDTYESIENLQGSAFADRLWGNSEANEIVGAQGDDIIDGEGGDDRLLGNEGSDRLLGNSGDDYLDGGLGDDSLEGGSGTDTASYQSSTVGVWASLEAQGAFDTHGAGMDTYIDIENLEGSDFNDRLWGDEQVNLILGGDGDDIVAARGGNDRVEGGNGNDRLIGEGGNDLLIGGSGNDTLEGRDNNDTLDGGEGDDTLIGGTGTDRADYSQASGGVWVNLNTSGAQDTKSAGSDTLSEIENIRGSSYDDRLWGDDHNNTLEARDGNDIIDGRGGDDVLNGGDGDDRLIGGDGDDWIIPGDDAQRGNDTIEGGAGSDTVDYSTAKARVIVNLETGTTRDGSGRDTLSSIENIIGSDYLDTFGRLGDKLNGSNADNYIDGRGADDDINGYGGNDHLLGGSGYDRISGGDGDDRIEGGSGPDDLWGDGGDDLIIGGSGVNYMDGGDGNDRIVSQSDGDTGVGGNHNDIFFLYGSGSYNGDHGDDLFVMRDLGSGNLNGGIGIDTVSYAERDMPIRADLNTTVTTYINGFGDDFLTLSDGVSQIENLHGSKVGDIIKGTSGTNELFGGGGNDVIEGREGDDTIRGSSGDDELDGGDGVDTVDYSDTPEGVNVRLYQSTQQNTGLAGLDTLRGFENVTGSSFDDNLWGNAGSNTLDGSDGNDTFDGLEGDDYYIGGNGFDTVSYLSENTGVTIDLGSSGAQEIQAGVSETLLSIEGLIGSNYDDTLVDAEGNNRIEGRQGNDLLKHIFGNDELFGGEGNDLITTSSLRESQFFGGVGQDTLRINLDSTEVLDAATLSDLQQLGIFIDQMSAGGIGEAGAEQFNFAQGLVVSEFEALEIWVDGTLNTAPVIDSELSFAVDEDISVVGQVHAIDAQNQVLTYSIVGGDDAALFALGQQGGELQFINAPDFDVPGDANGDNLYEITIAVADPYGGYQQQDLNISVINVVENVAPEFISAANFTVAENQSAVGQVMASDENDDTLSFRINGGQDAARFIIAQDTGVLSFVEVPDFEHPSDLNSDNIYDLELLVSDPFGGEAEQLVSVVVTDVYDNNAPIFTSANQFSINEEQPFVGSLTASDADNDPLMFSFFGGEDAHLFRIDPYSNRLMFQTEPDFENPSDFDQDNIYFLQLKVDDLKGGFDIQNLTVHVRNVTEQAPDQAPIIHFGEVNLVANASFENPQINTSFWSNLNTGLNDWEILGNNIDLIGSYWNASEGAQSLDLSGGNTGAVQQSITTSPGTLYQLSFDLSKNPALGAGATVTVQASAGNDMATYSFNQPSVSSDMLWQEQNLSFVAEDISTLLSIEALAPINNPSGPALDNVNVKAIGFGTMEDTPLQLTGISISDSDAGESLIDLVLSVQNGVINLDDNSGVEILIDGQLDGTLAIRGGQTALNNALTGLHYTPALNFAGEDTLYISVNNQLSTEKSLTIAVSDRVDRAYSLENLVGGGSFESPDTGAGFTTLGTGSTSLSGWSIDAGSVDVIGGFWQAANGNQSLDMNGDEPATISQSIATTIGSDYVLSFAMSKNTDAAISADTATVALSAGNSDGEFSFSETTSAADMKWAQHSLGFTAQADSTALQVQSTAPSGASGPALDDLVVVEVLTITDFAVGIGMDILDFSALLTSVGAPRDGNVFDGWLNFDNGSGTGTVIGFDSNGGGDHYVDIVTLVGTVLTESDTGNFVL